MLILGIAIAASTPVAAIEIDAAAPGGPLKGTMVLPVGNAPIILMIPGSGPTDRDGNSPLGVNAAPYRLLAQGLAEHGIGSVRIDKRGMFGSKGAVADANAVTIADYVRDISAWIEAIRLRSPTRCIWLLGHSEGGLVALAATANRVEPVCGTLLVATPGRPLGDVLKEQLSANSAYASLLSDANHAIDALAAGQRIDVSGMPPAVASLFRPALQGFLISLFALDPAELAGRSRKPLLILQGERDLQVQAADGERLKRSALFATLVTLPNTNHVLKWVDTDDRKANIATYAAADLPIAHGVVEAIARFVRSHQE